MDFLPTLAHITGAEAPQDRILDGHDIRSLILGDADATTPYEALYYYRRNNLNAVRRRNWKLHLDEDLLFDLESDIGETRNRYHEHPDIVKQLKELADACRQDLGDERMGIEGKNCRPVGRVENSKPLTSMNWTHPYMQAAYD